MVSVTTEVLCGDLTGRMVVFLNQMAGDFKSSMWIENDEHRVNAKGLLDVMSLEVRKGDIVRIIADGSDEEEAVEKIRDFITTEFDL